MHELKHQNKWIPRIACFFDWIDPSLSNFYKKGTNVYVGKCVESRTGNKRLMIFLKCMNWVESLSETTSLPPT